MKFPNLRFGASCSVSGSIRSLWIEGTDSFACYPPSSNKVNEAKKKEFQYSDVYQKHFAADIESEENIKKSETKLVGCCNRYFGSELVKAIDCQKKLYKKLQLFKQSKATLLLLAQEAFENGLSDEPLDQYIEKF